MEPLLEGTQEVRREDPKTAYELAGKGARAAEDSCHCGFWVVKGRE